MNKNDVKWTTDWNYKVVESYLNEQNDWNQTLITKINQISAQIFKTTLSGSANCIALCSKLKPLIETLLFYKDGYLAEKYKVIIDDSLDSDTILVYKDNPKNDKYFKIIDGNIHELPRSNDEEEYQEYLKKHYGRVIIQNYGE